jgi:hypothetical protein
MTKLLRGLSFGIWNLFVIWNLEFGIYLSFGIWNLFKIHHFSFFLTTVFHLHQTVQ